MKLRVEYDELEYITKMTEDNKSELEMETKKMLACLERIRGKWEGTAAEIFYEKAHDYIERMEVLCSFMETTSKLIKYGEKTYQEQDESFAKDIDREEIEDEPIDR